MTNQRLSVDPWCSWGRSWGTGWRTSHFKLLFLNQLPSGQAFLHPFMQANTYTQRYLTRNTCKWIKTNDHSAMEGRSEHQTKPKQHFTQGKLGSVSRVNCILLHLWQDKPVHYFNFIHFNNLYTILTCKREDPLPWRKTHQVGEISLRHNSIFRAVSDNVSYFIAGKWNKQVNITISTWFLKTKNMVTLPEVQLLLSSVRNKLFICISTTINKTKSAPIVCDRSDTQYSGKLV